MSVGVRTVETDAFQCGSDESEVTLIGQFYSQQIGVAGVFGLGELLVFVVLGGMGNIVGTIISTVILYMLPELLREFSDYRMLIYAIILILVMLVTNNDRIKLIRANASAAIMSWFRKAMSRTKNQPKGKEDAHNG